MKLLEIILLYLAALLVVVVGLAVFQRRKTHLNNVGFSLLCFSMAGWAFGIAAFLGAPSDEAALIWAKVYYLFPIVIAIGLTIFTTSFPDKKRVVWLAVVPALVGGIILALTLLIQRDFLTATIVEHDWGREVLLTTSHYLIYSVYLLLFYGLALVVMYRKSLHEKGIFANQARLFFCGFLVTFIFGVGCNLLLPWFGNYRLIWLGPLFLAVFAVIIAYSIIRHKMFDIRFAIGRSVAYLLLVVALAGLYAAIIYAASFLFLTDQAEDPAQRLLAIVSGVVVAFTFQPLKRFFDAVSDKIFFRNEYNPQVVLDAFGAVVAENIQVIKLFDASLALLSETLKPSFIQMVALDDHGNIHTSRSIGEGLNAGDARLAIGRFRGQITPINILNEDVFTKDDVFKDSLRAVVRLDTSLGLHGFIFMGEKQSGASYTKKDINLLEVISDELAVAIENSLRYEEIQGFNATLQARVEDATRELKHSNKKLKELDEAKDEFISMASHQLRTPLTSMKGYVSMVLEGDAGDLNESQRKLLEQAFISSQRMVYLIGDFLNVSRLQTGRFELEKTQTNLADLIDEELKQLQASASVRGITLDYQTPVDFPVLNLDATKIRQVLMNFIDNALFYSPSGSRVEITLKAGGRDVTFEVKDRGIGVPKSEQAHLFSKFYRASNARRMRPDGTGIGLFMAKKVVVAHGGSIIFHSREGQGSTFGFRLPRRKDQRESFDQKPRNQRNSGDSDH